MVAVLKQQFGETIEISDDPDVPYSVYIHFDFDEYQPDKMEDLRLKDPIQKGKFKVYRVIPQGKFLYFFSF